MRLGEGWSGAEAPNPLPSMGICVSYQQWKTAVGANFKYLRSSCTCQILSPSVYSVVIKWQRNPNATVFWTLAYCGVANWRHAEKVECGCKTTKLLFNGIKIICIFQHQGEVVHINSVIQKQIHPSFNN